MKREISPVVATVVIVVAAIILIVGLWFLLGRPRQTQAPPEIQQALEQKRKAMEEGKQAGPPVPPSPSKTSP
jgi:uncharacterized membrane protein YfbV (UPF0208 family)